MEAALAMEVAALFDGILVEWRGEDDLMDSVCFFHTNLKAFRELDLYSVRLIQRVRIQTHPSWVGSLCCYHFQPYLMRRIHHP